MTCGASVSAAIGGLGAGCRVVGGEFDGVLVGCVLPLTGSLQLVETRFGVDLHRELPAHADRRRGHLRGDRDDEGALLLVAARAEEELVGVHLVGGGLAVDGYGRDRRVRTG